MGTTGTSTSACYESMRPRGSGDSLGPRVLVLADEEEKCGGDLDEIGYAVPWPSRDVLLRRF